MNAQAVTFGQLMEKYRFIEPVSPGIQTAALVYRRLLLVKVLRASGNYSVIYGLSLRLYFRLRSLGSGISSGQCVALTYGIIATAALLLSATIYISQPQTAPLRQEERSIPFNPDNNIKPPLEKIDVNRNMSRTVLVADFSAENVDIDTARIATDAVILKLKSAIGENSVGIRGKDHSSRILMGSVGRLGNLYLVTVRVVDSESGRVVFSASGRANGPDEIKDAAADVAERVGENLVPPEN